MSSPGDDKDLEDFLNRRSDVSRRYRSSEGIAANEEPPAELDRAVLAKARAAVSAPSNVRELPVRNRTRWMVPFALAATVLLSFAIFREAGIQPGVGLREADVPVSAPATLEAPVESDQAAMDSSGELAAVIATAVPDLAAESARKTELSASNRAVVAQESFASPAATRDAVAAQPSAAPATPQSPVAQSPIAPEQEARAAGAEQEADASPPSRPVLPVMRAANVLRSAAAPPPQVAKEQASEQRTPEVWLEDVRKLRANGQQAEADVELKLFLDANPDYFEKNPDIAKP